MDIGKLVGNTPIIKIDYEYEGKLRSIYSNLEFYNYSGSIKDRIAAHIIKTEKENGNLKDGQAIVEVTSGNTGIAFSAMGALFGHEVHIFMPDWVSIERRKLIQMYGAHVHLVSKEEGGFKKALELANGTPIYAVMTLHSYAFPFKDFPQTVLSVIDAKKEKFYAAAYRNGKIFIPADDYEIKDLLEKLKDCGELLICGPDRFSFKEILKKAMPECPVFCTEFDIPSTDSLFAIAEEMRLKNAAPLADYDGPEYMRASEAEENLNR